MDLTALTLSGSDMMNELETMQRKMDRQTDTYMNMFAAVCEERKCLIRDAIFSDARIKQLNVSIANRDMVNGDIGKKVQCLQNEVKELAKINKRLQLRLPK